KEERVLLHGIAADVLEVELTAAEENQHNVHIVAARLAAHATIAERYQRAAEAYLKGAQWVWKSYSADESLNLIDQCLQTVHSQKAPAHALRSVGLDALLLKAEINLHCGRSADASVLYADAIKLANEIGTPEQRCKGYIGLSIERSYGGHHVEVESIARMAHQTATEVNDMASCARALNIIGNSYKARSMYDSALDYFQQSMHAAVATGDEKSRARALMNMGNVQAARGNRTSALEHHESALVLYRSLNDALGTMRCLGNIGGGLANRMMSEQAIETFEEALRLARLTGDVRAEARILLGLSQAYNAVGRYGEALVLAQRGLVIQEQIGDLQGVAYAFFVLGNIFTRTHRFDDALHIYQKGITLATEIGDQIRVADLNRCTGYVYLMQSRYAEALQFYEASRKQYAMIGMKSSQIASAIGAAWCSLKLEALETAGAGGGLMKASALLVRTQSLVREEDFSMPEYESQSTAWLKKLSKFGITLDA
ncbi:MAG: tetratricopeptide repeat protein, partial [bacterium]|nr:tetratricopeptide repeat protein [bacterium]